MARKYKNGIYKPKHPEKYVGDVTNIVYRSSWEWKFMRWCDFNPNVLKWQSEETIIPYICKTDNKPHRYFVDFKLKVRTKDGSEKIYLVEVKPKSQTVPPVTPKRKTKSYNEAVMTYAKNISKWEYATKYCKERGYEFMLITEEHLGI